MRIRAAAIAACFPLVFAGVSLADSKGPAIPHALPSDALRTYCDPHKVFPGDELVMNGDEVVEIVDCVPMKDPCRDRKIEFYTYDTTVTPPTPPPQGNNPGITDNPPPTDGTPPGNTNPPDDGGPPIVDPIVNPPAAVPLPGSGALSAVGVAMAGLAAWRSKRRAIA